MATLRLHDVVDSAFAGLAQLTQAEREDLANHGLEAMREVLLQVVVQQSCIQHQQALDFLRKSLLLLKGRLMTWQDFDIPTDVIALPLPKMPQRYWESKHPSRQYFLQDVELAISTMQQFPMAFQGQPWQWLSDFYVDMHKALS